MSQKQKKKEKVISTSPNILCYQCKQKGTYQVYEIEGIRKDRMIHQNRVCELGDYWGSYEEVIERFSDQQSSEQVHTLEEYEAVVEDISRASRLLDEPRYKIIKQNVLNKLFRKDLFSGLERAKSKGQKLAYYQRIIENIMEVVRGLDAKTYAGSGKSLKREFIKVLRNAGFWDDNKIQ